MHRRDFIRMAPLGVLIAHCAADAQPGRKIHRIGHLSSVDPATSPDLQDAFRAALRELGYVEGRNIEVQYRWTDGTTERLPELATELVRTKVDVIFAWATPAAIASKQ